MVSMVSVSTTAPRRQDSAIAGAPAAGRRSPRRAGRGTRDVADAAGQRAAAERDQHASIAGRARGARGRSCRRPRRSRGPGCPRPGGHPRRRRSSRASSPGVLDVVALEPDGRTERADPIDLERVGGPRGHDRHRDAAPRRRCRPAPGRGCPALAQTAAGVPRCASQRQRRSRCRGP